MVVWDCPEKLNDLGKNNKITLLWMPGHIGVEGNKHTDKLARVEASIPLFLFTGPEPFFDLGDIYFKEVLMTLKEKGRADLWERRPRLTGQRTPI